MENKRYKYLLFLLLLLAAPGFANTAGKDNPSESDVQQSVKRVTINVSGVPLNEILLRINKQSGVAFAFEENNLTKNEKFSLRVTNVTVEQALRTLLNNTKYDFKVVSSNKITIIRRAVASASKSSARYTINGTVSDENGKPMPGTTIILEGSTIGAISDQSGRFTLRVGEPRGRLKISFAGFKTQSVEFTEGKPLSVRMMVDTKQVDEVQIVAYGTQKKRLMTSSVASVKAEQLKELPTHSLENLLQGQMAGVEVNNISGSPGGGGSIVAIRGYNSMLIHGESSDRNYGTPLYVVDGVPMKAFTSPVTGSNTLSDIDPAMIESIEVLKDAASAAIYGSRAGNGVILITTKKGKSGKAMFTANASYSSSWLPETPLVSGGNYERRHHIQWVKQQRTPYLINGEWKTPTSMIEAYQNRYDKGPQYDGFWNAGAGVEVPILQDSLNSFYNNSSDWWRNNYRVASVYNVNIQATGGSEKFRYAIGAAYYNEEGIAINTGFERANISSNMNAQLTRSLTLDYQQQLSYSNRSRGSNAGSAAQKIEGITSDPMYTSTLLPNTGAVSEAFMSQVNGVSEKNNSYSARGSMRLNYEILPKLNLSISGGYDFNQQMQNVFTPSTLDQYSHLSKSEGNVSRNINLVNENLLTYSLKIGKNHAFDFMAGLSFEHNSSYKNEGWGRGGANDKIHYVDRWGNSDGLINVGGYLRSATYYGSDFEESRMNSYFGRLTYNFKERYLFETTLRRDGSSVFGENVRWATFPSVSVGWIFSDEAFMHNFYWLSFGKIRTSWGKSGQMFSQNYLAHGLMAPDDKTFNGVHGMQPNVEGGVINRSLTWEETNQYDVGLDLSFLNHRIKLTADYYYRRTTGQLNQVDLPGNYYFHSFQWINSMKISNSGIEIAVNADVFNKTQVKWRTRFNLSRNWNRFLGSHNNRDFKNAIIGKPLHQISVLKTNGYYASDSEVPFRYNSDGVKQPLYSAGSYYNVFFQGTRRIVDLNGDGAIDSKDNYFAGSPLPKVYGGWANEITWRNFDLNVMFTYSLGRKSLKVYDDFHIAGSVTGGPIYADVRKLDYWTPNNPSAKYPMPISYSNLGLQYTGYYDCDIENVNLLRLKQITLGYNLPDHISKKVGISKVRIFVTCENLFLLTNYSGLDPELIDVTSGSDNMRSYPLPRKFTMGLTLNF